MLAGMMALAALAESQRVSAAGISVLCSNGIKAVMEELVPQFERASGHSVSIRYGVSTLLKREIDAGQSFDVAVLTPQLIDDLVRQGTITADTRTPLARSGMGLAIRPGSAKPDISTTEALKRTLLSSSIAYAREGAGGLFFTELAKRLEIADALQSKTRLTTTGEEVGESVARGDAAVGVLPLSEILSLRGVEVLGPFPPDVQGYMVMVAGVSSRAAERTAARALITFLTAPAAMPVMRKRGMEPASATEAAR
jgi:molybdate transport system substrate-binding protein